MRECDSLPNLSTYQVQLPINIQRARHQMSKRKNKASTSGAAVKPVALNARNELRQPTHESDQLKALTTQRLSASHQDGSLTSEIFPDGL